MFSKAIVLSETDFRSLALDLFEQYKEQIKDYDEEPSIDSFIEFIEGEFECLTECEQVDSIVAFLESGDRYITDGRSLAYIILDYYNIKDDRSLEKFIEEDV